MSGAKDYLFIIKKKKKWTRSHARVLVDYSADPAENSEEPLLQEQ